MENKILEFLKSVIENNKPSGIDFDSESDNIYRYYDFMKGNKMVEHITIELCKNKIVNFHIVRFGENFEDYNEKNFEEYSKKYLENEILSVK